eukprot:NODE_45_length_32908_cov_0.790271.p17 type:complete len:273 gc:universal NODE_45_length_32908_cov_0.790271:14019-14837(+)
MKNPTDLNFLTMQCLSFMLISVVCAMGNYTHPSAIWSPNIQGNASFEYFKSTFIVPDVPSSNWTSFEFYQGIADNNAAGTTSAKLNWGKPACPDSTNLDYEHNWWVSAEHEIPANCSASASSNKMIVQPGIELTMIQEIKDNQWIQTITDLSTGKSISFTSVLNPHYSAMIRFEPGENKNGIQWNSEAPPFGVKDIELHFKSGGNCNFAAASQKDFGSVECDEPVKADGKCTIKTCKFNGYNGSFTGVNSTSSASSNIAGFMVFLTVFMAFK